MLDKTTAYRLWLYAQMGKQRLHPDDYLGLQSAGLVDSKGFLTPLGKRHRNDHVRNMDREENLSTAINALREVEASVEIEGASFSTAELVSILEAMRRELDND